MKARTLLFSVALGPSLAIPGQVHAAPTAPSAVAPVTPPPAPKPPASRAASSPAPVPVTPAAAGSSAPASAAASAKLKPEAKLPPAKTALETALLGTVRLERAGRPIGIGTLLSGDGRILTALSPLTHGNQIDARYAEGQLVHVKIGFSDRGWDLALLIPDGDAQHAGLKASRDPAPTPGSKLHAVSISNNKLVTSELVIKGWSTLRGGDSAQLIDALELPFAPKAIDIGAPLLDDKGEVVAVIARACSARDKAGCTLLPYGAPVSAIRSFLRSVPVRRGPWLGLEVVSVDAGIARGVRVAALANEGPAWNAGLRAGPPGTADVVIAVDGTPVSTSEAFSDAVEAHAPSVPLRLLLLSGGRYREVALSMSDKPDVGMQGREDRVIQSNKAPPWPRPLPPSAPPSPHR